MTMTITTVAISPRVVSKEIAAQLLSLSVKSFERLVAQGSIPKPRQLSPNRVGWLVSDIDSWAEKRPVSELLPPSNTGAPKPRNNRQGEAVYLGAA